MKQIRGLRNCSCGCRGLISGKSYRTKSGTRKRYFENKDHFKRWYEKEVNKYMPRGMKITQSRLDVEANKYLKDNLESVYVIQPKS